LTLAVLMAMGTHGQDGPRDGPNSAPAKRVRPISRAQLEKRVDAAILVEKHGVDVAHIGSQVIGMLLSIDAVIPVDPVEGSALHVTYPLTNFTMLPARCTISGAFAGQDLQESLPEHSGALGLSSAGRACGRGLATGTLVATARWATDAQLAMFFKTAADRGRF